MSDEFDITPRLETPKPFTLKLAVYATAICLVAMLGSDYLHSGFEPALVIIACGGIAVAWTAAVGYPFARCAMENGLRFRLRTLFAVITLAALLMTGAIAAGGGSFSFLVVLGLLVSFTCALWIRYLQQQNSIGWAALCGAQLGLMCTAFYTEVYVAALGMFGNCRVGDYNLGATGMFAFLVYIAAIRVWPILALIALGIVGGCMGWYLKRRAKAT